MMFDTISPAAMTVLKRLNAAGYAAYLVGGCIRDLLMGIQPHDWDIATAAAPETVCSLFGDHTVVATGLSHGTVTVVISHTPVEVTTFRLDGSYSDNRHPDAVRFTTQITEDLGRRDFTVNAMAFHPETGICDPYGGQHDLAAGVLRCVGDPDTRFSEDALRILRALRFSAVLGFSIEAQTADSLIRHASRLQSISAERIYHEFNSLICGKMAGDVLLRYLPVIGVFLPELLPLNGYEQHNPHHCYDIYTHSVTAMQAIPPQPALRLAALFHDCGKPACDLSVHSENQDCENQDCEKTVGHFPGHAAKSEELTHMILRRLRADHATEQRVCTMIRHHSTLTAPEKTAVLTRLRRWGADTFRDVVELQMADCAALAPDYRNRAENGKRLLELVAEIEQEERCFSLKQLKVNGTDLKALSFGGKAIGEALSLLLDGVIDGTLENERTSLLKKAAQLFRESGKTQK